MLRVNVKISHSTGGTVPVLPPFRRLWLEAEANLHLPLKQFRLLHYRITAFYRLRPLNHSWQRKF